MPISSAICARLTPIALTSRAHARDGAATTHAITPPARWLRNLVLETGRGLDKARRKAA